MIRQADMTHELQSRGWTLDEAISRVTNSTDGRPEIASLLAAGRLLAYTCDKTGRSAKLSNSDFDDGWLDAEKRLSQFLIFPILHSPDVCAFISGSSLRDIFQSYVLNDPEVRQLSIEAIRVDPDTARVLEGNWQPRGAAEWPVNNGILDENDPYEWTESKLALLMSRDTPDEVRKFRHVLRLRFGALLNLLQSGKLRALGDPVRSGDNQEILPTIWSHRDFLLDAKAGDLVQWNDGSGPLDRRSRLLGRWRAIVVVGSEPNASAKGNFSGSSARRDDDLASTGKLPEMAGYSSEFPGWRIAEAIRRCVDRDLISAWFARLRGARSQGPGQGHTVLPNVKEGDDRLTECLRNHLSAARLAAWGRRASPTAASIAIPAAAWRSLTFLDIRGSVVREQTNAQAQIFDVRIFPVVDSPDAIDQLAGKSFVEAFQTCVVNDPELNVLRELAKNIGAGLATLGDHWEPYRAVWSVEYGKRGGSGAIGFMRKFDETKKYNREKAVQRVMAQRFGRLVRYISEGSLSTEAIPSNGGVAVRIPRSLWQRDRTYIDLENGDVLELESRAADHAAALSRPIYKGVMLIKRIPDSVVIEPETPAETSDQLTGPSAVVITPKTTSRDACRKWLVEEMRRSPDKRPAPKEAYRKQALDRWEGSLSSRMFDRVWMDAIIQAPAERWSSPGRPNKSPQS
jgi:hypothetical protein